MVHRTDPGRLASWVARDLERELRARGHVPDPAKLLEGIKRGLEGPAAGEDGGGAAP